MVDSACFTTCSQLAQVCYRIPFLSLFSLQSSGGRAWSEVCPDDSGLTSTAQ